MGRPQPSLTQGPTAAPTSESLQSAHSEDDPSQEIMLEEFFAGPVLPELHHLLWTKPRVNRGTFDLGWNCRDHAVSIAAILSAEGHEVSLRYGRCTLVQGPTEGGLPPVAISVDGLGETSHAWAFVEGFGNLDASPKLDLQLPRWRRVRPNLGLTGTRWPLEDMQTAAVVCSSSAEYHESVARATHSTDTGTAIYQLTREEPFATSMLSDGVGYVNSLITRKICELAGPNCYVKLVTHVLGVRSGKYPSLATKSWAKAWTRIAEIPDQEADDLLNALQREPPSLEDAQSS